MEKVTVEYDLQLGQLRAAVEEIKTKYRDLESAAKQSGKSGSDAFDKTAKSVDSVSSKVKDLPKSLSLADKASGALSSTLGKVAAAAAGAFALERILAFGAEAVQTALKVEGIELAYNKLNRPDLLDKLRAATKGTVDDMTLMQNAVKANNFKIPLDALANMFAFAEQRARDTGESVDFLVESAVLGISRQSLMILDNLGISGEAVRAEMEKTGDMATAVSNIMAQELAKQGSSVETAGQKVDRYAAQWNNFKVGFGKMLIDMGVGLAEGLEVFDYGLKKFFNFFSKGLLFPSKSTTKKEVGVFMKDFYTEIQQAEMKGDVLLVNILKTEEKRQQKKKEAQATTLEALKAELTLLQQTLEKQEIGSAKFKSTLLEIERIQNRIDTATGKNAEKLKKAAEDARKEKERLSRTAIDKVGINLTSVDNSENILEAEKRLNDQVLEESKRFGDALAEYQDKQREEKKDKDREAAAFEKQLREETAAQAVSVANAIFELSSAINNAELQELEDKKTKGVISEKEYAKQVADIKRKQAIADKAQALFNIGVNTAVAVTKITAEAALAAPLLIPLILAMGALQAGAVLATPLPEIPAYARGGRIKGKEQIIRVNEKGEEFVANDIATKRHTEELEAMNKGGKHYERLIYKRYIAPAMKANQNSTYKEKSFVFDDSGLRHDVKKLRTIDLSPKTVRALAEAMPVRKRRTPNG